MCKLGVLAALGALTFTGWAQGIALEASTFAPDPGGAVVFQVIGAPTGAQFRWDFNGDGRWDLTTEGPLAQWTVPAGAWETVVEAVQGGRVVGQARAVVVADARLAAVRFVRSLEDVLEVTITLKAKTRVVAPGIEEVIPAGWIAVVVDDGSSLYKVGETLQAVWPTILDPGWEVKLVYQLHPTAGGAFPHLQGLASGYILGERFEVKIAGPVGR